MCWFYLFFVLEVENASPNHNEEIVGVPDPHLFLSGEDITSGNFPGYSGNCQLQLDTEESDATSFDSQGISQILCFVKIKLGRASALNNINLDYY